MIVRGTVFDATSVALTATEVRHAENERDEAGDGERIEINTQGHHRYSHIHLLAADPNKTVQWYADNLKW